MLKLTIEISLIVLLCACNLNKTDLVNHDVSYDKVDVIEITIANGEGYCFCPFDAIRFNKSGKASYYAGKYCEKPGFYEGTIDSIKWNSIDAVLKAINYDTLHSSYDNNEDCTVMEILIKNDSKKYHIDGGTCAFNIELETGFDFIYNIKESIKWTAITDSIIFETTAQSYKEQLFPAIEIK